MAAEYRRGTGPNALPQPLELAWAAGFFDGEAWIGTRKDSRGSRAATTNIKIHQVDRAPLDRFRVAVGVGTVYGPYAHGRRNDGTPKTIFSYQTNKWSDSQAVVGMLWRFLSSPKRRQAAESLRELHVDPEWHSSARLLGPGAKHERRKAQKRAYYARNKHLWGVKNA